MRFAVAVAEERNFTRAAARCHITQPALSRQVSELEQELGTKLFERGTRKVAVTPSGHIFVREARRALEHSARTVSFVQAFSARNVRPVVVGVSLLADVPRLQPVLDQARNQVKGLRVQLERDHGPSLVRALSRGDCDLILTEGSVRERGIQHTSMFTEPNVVALPDKFRIPKQPSVSLKSLVRSPLVLISSNVDLGRAAVDQALDTTGTRSFKIHEAGLVSELLDEVALHGLVGLLRQSSTRFHRQGVVYKQLSEPVEARCVLAWRKDNLWPTLVSLRDAILAFAQNTR